MKNVVAFIFALMMAAPVWSSPVQNEKYCAKMKDGKLTVMQNKAELTIDVTLSNGTVVKTDGEVIRKDGTKLVLKDGECVDNLGNLVKAKDEKKKEGTATPVK